MGSGQIPPFARQISLSRITFICAMDWEAACLPSTARVVCAGIGPARAVAAAERAVQQGAQYLISFGSAAGVDPAVRSGALLVAGAAVALAEANLQRVASDPWCPPDDWWQRVSGRLGALEPCAGSIVQCPDVLHTVAQKQALFARSGAQAADMESAMIARVAARHRLPFAAVRVVLDDAHTGLPRALVAACDDYGRVRPAVMLKTLVRRPSLLLSLPGLARAQRCVVKTLTAAGQLLASDNSGVGDEAYQCE